jgi:FSR family fosmidomycin resistance protein-like MFS transporter
VKNQLKTEKGIFQTGNVIIISISHFLHDVYTSFLAPALPLLIEKLQINNTMAGLLYVFQRIPALLNPAVGIMADKMKMRYITIISPAVTAIAMSLIGVAPGYIFLALILMVSGLSSTLFHVPTPVMIKKVSGDKLGRGMSFYMLGGELARTVGPMVIYGIISLWGIEGTYKMMPLGIMASVLMYIRLRNIEVSSNIDKSAWKTNYFKIFLRYLPIFIVTAGITFFLGAMKASLTYYLPTYMKASGETLFFADASLSVLQLAGAAGTFISGTLSDKLGRTRTLLIITMVTPFLMLWFLSGTGVWQIIILAILGLFLFAPTSVLLALIHEQKSDNLAFLNGTFMFLNFFIGAIVYPVVGYMADKMGFEKTFYYAALFSFGSVIIVFLSRKKLG